MKPSLIILITLLGAKSYCQSQNNDIDYFKEGIKAFENADYLAADTLFTEAYRLMPERKACYNIGLTKFMLEDLCGGCMYMKIGKYRYNDLNSTQLFDELCIRKIDSLYLDKNYNPLNSSKKHRYLVEEVYFECDSSIQGIIHKKGYSSTIFRGGDFLSPETVNIFARYTIIDSVKYYDFIGGSTFEFDNNNLIDDFDKKLEKYLGSKYDFSLIPGSEAYCVLQYYVDKRGNVTDVDIGNFPSEYFEEEVSKEIQEDIRKAILGLKGLKPEKYRKQYVASQQTILIGLYK